MYRYTVLGGVYYFMKHGSLFSGIGGFDLASEWMGWDNVFHCEWNDFGKKVLKYYWPKAISYDDITRTDFYIHRGQIDILTGGFPCQPYSMAGKRLGKEDERHLWPEMLRAIREIQPRWIVGENVLGLVNWNGGLVFEEVQADLENQGYEVQPYILPAVSVNAPHRRDRVWFVAKNSKNTDSIRQKWRLHKNKPKDAIWKQFSKSNSRFNKWNAWQNFPTQSPICNGNDGISNRLDSITFSKWRAESIKAGGNAIVPQVVLQIFKAIEQYEFNRLQF